MVVDMSRLALLKHKPNYKVPRATALGRVQGQRPWSGSGVKPRHHPSTRDP